MAFELKLTRIKDQQGDGGGSETRASTSSQKNRAKEKLSL